MYTHAQTCAMFGVVPRVSRKGIWRHGRCLSWHQGHRLSLFDALASPHDEPAEVIDEICKIATSGVRFIT